MLSKNKIKEINALSQKKNRDEAGLFLAEGTKLVIELASAFECHTLVATSDWLRINGFVKAVERIETDEAGLRKISAQKSPQGVIGVFRKPSNDFQINTDPNDLILCLDDVQDPGNLGTIIRIADWFGIKDIFCSVHSADAFGPKTVQATMGALARVKVHSVDLAELIRSLKPETPVYGTFMNGEDIYSKTLTKGGIIVMGNEGNGISPEIEALVTEKLLIPAYPPNETTSESLNVAVATALVCAEFRRRM